jgi:hypothetical protein
MFRQLGLSVLARTAIFTVHRSFHNHPVSILISSQRNFEVHITVRRIDAGFLKKCIRHMEHLKLSPSSRCVWSDYGVLRPTENGINSNLLRRNVGNRDVFRQMPESRMSGSTGRHLQRSWGFGCRTPKLLPLQPTLSSANRPTLLPNAISFVDFTCLFGCLQHWNGFPRSALPAPNPVVGIPDQWELAK